MTTTKLPKFLQPKKVQLPNHQLKNSIYLTMHIGLPTNQSQTLKKSIALNLQITKLPLETQI